jgi:hypothetical protein
MTDISYTATGVQFGDQYVSWDALEAERNKFRFSNSVLVTISFGYGRQDFTDVEIYDKDIWDKLKTNLDGLTVFFSDFAGKHSQIDLDLWTGVKIQETDDLAAIMDFHGTNGFYAHDLSIVQNAIDSNTDEGYLDEHGNRVPEKDDEDEDSDD